MDSINKNWSVSSISLKKSKNYRYINKVKYIYIVITNFKEINKKLKGSFSFASPLIRIVVSMLRQFCTFLDIRHI